MSSSDWNWRAPVELQDYPWDCAAASLAWALQAAGLPYTEQQVIEGLGPSRISPELGLLDASGAGLVDWLSEIGVTAMNTASASWTDIIVSAGYQPMVMGGRDWNHWTGLRMAGPCFNGEDLDWVALANPAPGWMGVGQYMNSDQFSDLGTFSAVWFTDWPR